MTNEATILCVVLVTICSGAQDLYDRNTLMSAPWQQLLRKTWRDVIRQTDIALRHHERQDYEALYGQIQTLSTRGHDHIPSWIPGEGDISGLKLVTLAQYEAGFYLLKLHRDLPKFQIMMEEIGRENGDFLALKHMMVSTRTFLEQLQRQVKKALMDLQIGVPAQPVRRTITSVKETTDAAAAGMARDRGILIRYRNYLRQWVRLWCAGARRRRRIQRRIRESTRNAKLRDGTDALNQLHFNKFFSLTTQPVKSASRPSNSEA
ncbi:uncharacterized protein LOC110835153 [Zootermopsis nevadensis]|uniref:uncharacterized protein LOC110835153 n=1 Tax=Zootermopsis nevadensis TaxID=136037 RepID=UPI000B8E2E54|nr:uncharacterized protein LOC110835153 [Zootermopsis nevadensis]